MDHDISELILNHKIVGVEIDADGLEIRLEHGGILKVSVAAADGYDDAELVVEYGRYMSNGE